MDTLAIAKQRYSKYREAAARMNETRDCVVRAIAVITGWSYERAHAACKAKGRVNRQGMYEWQYLPILTEAGYTVAKNKEIPLRYRTVRTLRRYLEAHMQGRLFLIHVRGHVAAFDGTTVVDWSANRMHRIEWIAEIVPPARPEPDRAKRLDRIASLSVWDMIGVTG